MKPKPCPFCANSKFDSAMIEKPNISYRLFAVVCLKCCAEGPHRTSEHAAKEAWNDRDDDDEM